MSMDANRGTSPADWFSPTHTYEGPARLEYADPESVVTGHAVAQLGESERRYIEFWPDEDSAAKDPLDFETLARVAKVTEQEGRRVFTLDFDPTEVDEPSRLVIEIPEGVFSSASVSGGGAKVGGTEASLQCLSVMRSEFAVSDAADAKYWVLPLFNYTADFVRGIQDHATHPLRLPSPERAEGERSCARSPQHTSGVIPFIYQGRPGYIQPLPDYYDRVEALHDGRAARLVTAVMVGDLGDLPMDEEGVMGWLPFDYLDLLSITSGNPVDMRWVEFRDAERRLVRRLYISTGPEAFHQGGHRPIEESVNRSTGLLLTEAAQSTFWNNPALRVVMGYLRRSAQTSIVEDRFLDLARAFEGLFALHRLRAPTLLDQCESGVQQDVKQELSDSAKRLRELSARVRAAGKNDQANVVTRVSDRALNAAQKSGLFGEVVFAVLNQYGFPDAQILEAHYARKSPTARPSWLDDLSYYRNAAAHGTYFDLGPGKAEITHVFWMSSHMLDMLLRILFKMLGYTGTYRPPVSIMQDDQPLDWVKPTTSAKRLSYR